MANRDIGAECDEAESLKFFRVALAIDDFTVHLMHRSFADDSLMPPFLLHNSFPH